MRRALALLLVLACPAAFAAAVEGRDYALVNPAQPTADPTKIVVIEFFSYQCPHCYRFSKPFAAWTKTLGADVKVERVAVSIGHEEWVPAAQAYYALVAMNALDQADDALFAAIHEKHARLDTEAALTDWAGHAGLDQAEFQRLYRSFSVGVQTRRADTLSRQHLVTGIPALVIDGKYMISVSDDGDFSDQLKVADELVAKVRKTPRKAP